MTCAAIMTPNRKAARETDSIGQAARQIIDNTYINLPAVDDQGRRIGMVSHWDAARHNVEGPKELSPSLART